MTRRPGTAVLLLAPVLGEVLSTATPPLTLLLPWILVLQVALYGGGALLCREVAARCRLGLRGLLLLGAAYGVLEEALVTGFWFDPGYQDDVGVGGYGRVWHTNLLLATHLTAFHTAVSVGATVLLVQRAFPGDRPWVGRRGLVLATLGLVVVVPLTYGDALRGPVLPMLAAVAVAAALVLAAFRLRPPGPDGTALDARVAVRRRPSRWAGPLAFLATGAHFLLVYTVPATGLPWPAGLALALAPVALAAAHLRGRVDDGLRVVAGILSFFLLLDALVGLAGRYDLTVFALAAAVLLRRLVRPRGRLAARPGPSPPRPRPRPGRRWAGGAP
jgi:hypothetical protein